MKNHNLNTKKCIHFIGIGGIGMSGIASILLKQGKRISGSDIKTSFIIEKLKTMGADIFIGHSASHIKGKDLVVYSSAIPLDNPELIAARRKGIPIIKRAQCLAFLMRDKINITVTGSHGKTTTTSLISHLLMRTGFSPTVAIGGILRKLDNNISLGNGSYFVAEADESDGSFLCYSPYYSIITNIDYEHLDYYRNWNRIIKTFKEFIERTDRRGCLFGCGDDMRIKEILDNYKKRYIFFGLQEHNNIYPFAIETNGLSSEFNCRYNGKDIGRFRIPLAGRHNISNSLAVIALGLELGIKFNDIKDAIGSYSGVERRFQIKLKTDRLAIVDDYAHHPTEIKRTLEAARVWINSSQDRAYKRLVVVFQPHRYSRTQYLLNQFAPSFIDSDYLVITDIYPASEAPIRGVSAASICKNTGELLGNQRVIYLPKDEIKNFISKNIITGDLVIFMGAGDIAKIADEVAEYFKGQDKAQ